jgi:mannose-6-phosphate isomerase-like protein (cupin superfamily)
VTAAEGPLVTTVADLADTGEGHGYTEVLRVPAMSMGVFTASPGYDDRQQPHAEDEVYVVSSGHAVLEISGTRTSVGPGSVAFVPAGVPHRFVDVSTDLQVLVLFAPAETGPASMASPDTHDEGNGRS